MDEQNFFQRKIILQGIKKTNLQNSKQYMLFGTVYAIEKRIMSIYGKQWSK